MARCAGIPTAATAVRTATLSSNWRTEPQASLSLPKASDTPTSDAAGMVVTEVAQPLDDLVGRPVQDVEVHRVPVGVPDGIGGCRVRLITPGSERSMGITVPVMSGGLTTLRWITAHAPGSAYAMRLSMWSPTRRALAIAVSAGFTAPMLGKKLVSTT
jgi:hypothetical protein